MTSTVAAAPDRAGLSVWCGWVLITIAAATPAFAWLAPKGFAALVALGGLLTLPAFRITDEDRPSLIILFGALIWAAASTVWSPFHPKGADTSTILKLALELPLYWSLVCAARRTEPGLQQRALHVLAWGLTAFAVILVAETVTDGAIYQALRGVFYPDHVMRPDIARAKLGHGTFVMTALMPIAFVGAPPRLRLLLGVVMIAGAASAAIAFGSDAPVIAIVVAPLVGFAVWLWPKLAPRLLAFGAAVMFLFAPLVVWAVRKFADYDGIEHAIPMSYAQRMGYWSHAIDWIAVRPVHGWGLDASRMFAPGIRLHPHDGALQVWLELGAIGAVTAAAFWSVTLLRLSGPVRNPAKAATAACAAVYLLFGALNFGMWQEWWLALGALIVALAALLRPSTSTPILA
ncbi:MAG TPA: O-antigen ligase family protein [Phenylobacterium sp.]|nr:O-antigen ligase family protein [Phenylobacterium sp.]